MSLTPKAQFEAALPSICDVEGVSQIADGGNRIESTTKPARIAACQLKSGTNGKLLAAKLIASGPRCFSLT
jgi:hypothetical protein